MANRLMLKMMTSRKRQINYCLATILLLCITLSSCVVGKIGDLPKFPDLEFNGVWVDNSVEVLIGEDSGLLSAVGSNNDPAAPWDKLSFTGRVERTPLGAQSSAEIVIRIWDTGNEGIPILIAEFPVVLQRNGSTIFLNLNPLQENYVLLKQ
jgi:hypothetical protein